jgi:hypothetical protein
MQSNWPIPLFSASFVSFGYHQFGFGSGKGQANKGRRRAFRGFPLREETPCGVTTNAVVPRQTKPIPGGGVPHHSTIPPFQRSNPMPIVRNKANSCQSDTKSKSFVEKELCRIGQANGLGKTKPIGRGVSSGKREVSSKRSPAASPPGLSTSHFTLQTSIVPNKANRHAAMIFLAWALFCVNMGFGETSY